MTSEKVNVDSYKVKSKSSKKTKFSFAYIFDSIRINAAIVLANNESPKRYQLGIDLTDSIIMPHIYQRLTVGLQQSAFSWTEFVTGTPLQCEGNNGNSPYKTWDNKMLKHAWAEYQLQIKIKKR